MISFVLLFINIVTISSATEYIYGQYSATTSIEDLAYEYEDDKNSMIAVADKDDENTYEDFYEELDNWLKIETSMNIIFFGPTDSFMRLDPETILHLLIHTKKHFIPLSRVLLAWDLITDGKTAAFLQGREYLAFGSLLNVVPEEDLYYVNFGDPSVMSYFAQHDIKLQNRKIGILVAAYRRYYGTDWYKNVSQINNLGYLLCGFPTTDLEKIPPVIFRGINIDVFNKLHRCSVDQSEALYKIATDSEAYGKPFKWTSLEVNRITFLFGLIPQDQISSISLEAISAISSKIMKNINQNKLAFFTKQQVLRMNPETRRIFILRMQLKSSLDINQLSKK